LILLVGHATDRLMTRYITTARLQSSQAKCVAWCHIKSRTTL
jgi:hypothetical protein